MYIIGYLHSLLESVTIIFFVSDCCDVHVLLDGNFGSERHIVLSQHLFDVKPMSGTTHHRENREVVLTRET